MIREGEVGLLTDLTNRRVDADTQLALRTGELTMAQRLACSHPSMNLPSLHMPVHAWEAPRLRFKPL